MVIKKSSHTGISYANFWLSNSNSIRLDPCCMVYRTSSHRYDASTEVSGLGLGLVLKLSF